MSHAVTTPTAPFKSSSGALEVHQVPAAQDNFIWLLVCTKTGAAAAVDGPSAAPALEYCKANGLTLGAIFNTHTHYDHIGINSELSTQGKLGDYRVVGSKLAEKDVPGISEAVEDGDTVTLGASTGAVMLTEGHINAHISFLFDDLLFCGDTLFAGGCGYLFDGPPKKMFDSLSRLRQLDGPVRVCCAHEYTQENLRFAWSVEPDNDALRERIGRVWSLRKDGKSTVPSTIEEERASNPFMRFDSPALIARVSEAWPDRKLETSLDVFTATRALKDRGDYRERGDDQLPL